MCLGLSIPAYKHTEFLEVFTTFLMTTREKKKLEKKNFMVNVCFDNRTIVIFKFIVKGSNLFGTECLYINLLTSYHSSNPVYTIKLI